MPVLTKINSNSIAEDAITGDKFAGDAYLSNTANQNISGTYSENRLYTSDAYTLSGNATVNSHLTLSSIKPTADVVLTAGGAYTLTGTGVLSGGSLLAKANTDLTGMTGDLGSDVTGSPALNLGNFTGVLPVGVTGGSGLDASNIGITHASQWRVTSDFTDSASPVASNWEETDGPAGFGVLGASMTESSGIFTFPATGYWFINWIPRGRGNSSAGSRMYGEIHITANNSNYYSATMGETWLTGTGDYSSTYMDYIMDVTSTTTHKLKFMLQMGHSSNTFKGSSEQHYNHVSFIRLGDT